LTPLKSDTIRKGNHEAIGGKGASMTCNQSGSYTNMLRWRKAETECPPPMTKVDAALARQCGNMAFILNHVWLPAGWYEKFSKELTEDWAALATEGARPTSPELFNAGE
jgi:hypothetical protein